MRLQKAKIEEFRCLYKRLSGVDLTLDESACMAQEFLELMKNLTDDYESHIDLSGGK